MGGSSSGLSSLDTRTTLGAAAPRRAAVRALRTGAGPLRRRSARFPRPRNRCVRLDHWVDTARPAPGKRNTGRSKYARPPAGRHPGAFWTAPRAVPPGWGETQTDFGPPHPQDASPSCGSGAPTPVVRWRSRRTVRWRFPRPRPIASGQATTYWGRKIAYPNAQFPTPMPGAGARQSPPHSSARLGTPTGEHPGRSHWLSARTGPPPPPPYRLGLGALDERTVE